jgi:hypothetical protein
MKRKMLGAVIAGLLAGVAWAADPMKGGAADKPMGGKPTATFDQVDSNKDGVISHEEARTDTTLSRMFKQLDRDSDGQLTEVEYDASAVGSPARPN